MPRTRSYRKAKELAGESSSSDENEGQLAHPPPQPQPQPQEKPVYNFGFEDTSNPGFFETFKVPMKGKHKYYVNTEIVHPRLNTDYFYKQKVKGVKHTSGCADPPRDPYQWEATIHQQVVTNIKKLRKLQGFNYLKQDPANTGKDTRFQKNNAEIIKEFKCIEPNCEARKRVFKGLKVFPIVPPDAPRPDEYMMFNVEYTLPHNHDELPPTPGQGPSGVTTGVTPTFMTSNISSNSPKKDDDDDNPKHDDTDDDDGHDTCPFEDTIPDESNLEGHTSDNTSANLETNTDYHGPLFLRVDSREGTPIDTRKNKAYNEDNDSDSNIVQVGSFQFPKNRQKGKKSIRNKEPLGPASIPQSTDEAQPRGNDPPNVNSGSGTSTSNVEQLSIDPEASDDLDNLRCRRAIASTQRILVNIARKESSWKLPQRKESPLSREPSTSNDHHYNVSNLDLENISWPMYRENPDQTINNLSSDRVVQGSIKLERDLDGWNIFSLDTVNKHGRLQKSKYHIMKKTTSKKGLVCAGDTIPKGTDLGIYPGRLISKQEFDEQFYTRTDHSLDIRNRNEDLIGILEPGQNIDILDGNNNLAFIKRARLEREVNVLPIAVKHTDGRILTHFMVTKDIQSREKLKTFFGPRKALIEDKIPLINFYNILADRTTARVCATVEREFMLTNPSYDPLYRKYFENIFVPTKDEMAPESVRTFFGFGCRNKAKQHLFRLGESSIRNAGDGIFATKKIRRGTSFGPYPGVLEDFNVFKQYLKQGRQETGYEYYIPNSDGTLSHVILPNIPSGRFKTDDNNWLVKINHDPTNTRNNLEPKCDERTKDIYFSAVKNIKRDEELLVKYDDYQSNLIVMNEVKKDAFARLIKRSTQRGS